MYKIFTESLALSIIFEIIGKNAASVFPLAVLAEIIKSLGVLIGCGITIILW